MAAPYPRYRLRDQVDTEKWNQCIRQAPNGLVYGYACYLDRMAKNWDALIWGDYEAVMPLPWNKKWGFYYLYQPALTASLGIFGNTVTGDMVKKFIRAIPSKFRLVEIDLNYGNTFPEQQNNPSFLLRNNYVLDLHRSYDRIAKGYRENTQRNIKKAVQMNCRFQTGIPIDDIISLSQKQMNKVSNLTGHDYNCFRELFFHLQESGRSMTCGVYTPIGQLVASCVFFLSHKRAYYILVGNHPNGKAVGASHFLIDRFIAMHAGQDLKLDFEGSDIRNLAFFYSSFGAAPEIYPALRLNRLPWWIKWVKS